MKCALVTGSTQGIGAAIADLLTQEGYTVFRNGRHANRSDEHYIQADVSTLEGVISLSGSVLSWAGHLDCLVLNAGATCRKPLTDITYRDWQIVMDTNLNMPFFLIQQLREHIAPGGSILFISSVLSQQPHSVSIPYGVSKAAVNMLAQYLVKEFAPRNIRVNVVCPGFIDTQWQKEKPGWQRENITRKTALHRFGSPGEVADLCVSLCRNTYVNGAVVRIDGGYDMTF